MKIKTTNSLMKYLREKKKININGSSQKNTLLNIGYYHAYKGCRFYNDKSNNFFISDFNQIEAIYNFDAKLKTIIYPHIMFIETALKNRTLQNIVEFGKSDKFVDLFETCFNVHKDFKFGTKEYIQFSNIRANFKAKIYSNLSKNFNNRIIGHFYKKDQQVPIWAIFEILTLGEFCNLYTCLNKKLRIIISKELKINQSMDADGLVIFNIIETLRNLRNAVAHNDFIYDTRFNQNKIGLRLSKYFFNEMGIKDFTFNSIVDYIILIAYMLKILKVNKTDIKKFLRDFVDIGNNFYNNIYSLPIFNKVLPSDYRIKINKFLQKL